MEVSNIAKARTSLSRDKFNITAIKADIRKKFTERLKRIRRDSFDSNRNLSEYNNLTDFVEDVRKVKIDLMKNSTCEEDLTLEILEKIEKELCDEHLQMRAELYTRQQFDEISAVHLTHSIVCPLCERSFIPPRVNNKICDDCSVID